MSIQLIVNGISLGAVYALIAVGFALVFSILKFSNFAHGGMISASAYIAYFFYSAGGQPKPLWLVLLVAGVGGIIVALILDTICYRRIRKQNSPSIYYFVASITFAILIEQILTVFYGKTTYGFPPMFKSTTFVMFGLTFSVMDFVILLITVLILVLLIIVIEKTKIGLAIRAVAIDSTTGRLMGINSSLVIIVVFALAGLLAGVSGTLLGMKYSAFPALGSSMMVKGFIASVIGGLGSLSGAIIAAILLGVLEMVFVYFLGSSVTPALLFGIMLLFLFVRPQGISGKFAQDKV
ncbi:MAG: branched-chain amino acid ABC transporter permease [Oscillospiraceae bacterium]